MRVKSFENVLVAPLPRVPCCPVKAPLSEVAEAVFGLAYLQTFLLHLGLDSPSLCTTEVDTSFGSSSVLHSN